MVFSPPFPLGRRTAIAQTAAEVVNILLLVEVGAERRDPVFLLDLFTSSATFARTVRYTLVARATDSSRTRLHCPHMGATSIAARRLERGRSRSITIAPPAPPAVAQAVGSRPAARTWQDEWIALRTAELTQCRMNQGSTLGLPSGKELEAWVQRNEAVKDWLLRHGEMVNWLIKHGWSGTEAAMYTCVSLGGVMTIGDALRRRSDQFSASTHALCESLWKRHGARFELQTRRRPLW